MVGRHFLLARSVGILPVLLLLYVLFAGVVSNSSAIIRFTPTAIVAIALLALPVVWFVASAAAGEIIWIGRIWGRHRRHDGRGTTKFGSWLDRARAATARYSLDYDAVAPVLLRVAPKNDATRVRTRLAQADSLLSVAAGLWICSLLTLNLLPCPGVRMIDIGRPRPSTARWILLVSPLRDRPMASPRCTGAQFPQDPVDHLSVITPPPAPALHRWQQRFDPLPGLIRQLTPTNHPSMINDPSSEPLQDTL